jgi:hypothetical protein
VHTKHEFCQQNHFFVFSLRTSPIHYFSSKTHVWGGFAQFRCRTSPIPNSGVRVHTKHEFCHQNHFFVFRNEHAQSTTLGSKLMFGVVSRKFVAARHPFRKRVPGVIQSTSFCHRNHFFVFRNELAQIYYFRSKTHVWGGLAQFHCRASPIPKMDVGVHTNHEFCHRNHFFVFRNEQAQSTTSVSKLMFGVVSRNFVATRHPFRKRVSGAYKARVLPPEPFLRFSQRTCPIHYFRSKTHVWGGFAQFHCRTSPIPKTGVGVHTKHEFLPPGPFLRFSQRTCPIHYFRSKTHVWRGFAQFRCRTSPIPKMGVRVHIQSTSFCHQSHFFVFRNEHAQSTNLGPKLMFGMVPRNFVAARHPFRKRVTSCIQSTRFLPPEPFLRFSQ